MIKSDKVSCRGRQSVSQSVGRRRPPLTAPVPEQRAPRKTDPTPNPKGKEGRKEGSDNRTGRTGGRKEGTETTERGRERERERRAATRINLSPISRLKCRSQIVTESERERTPALARDPPTRPADFFLPHQKGDPPPRS